MTSLTITREDLRKFAPRARPVYVDTLLDNVHILRDAGILDNSLRAAHFFAQCGAETGGFVVLRESLAYRPSRLREVWPSRFRDKSDAYLADLCADQIKLADAVYGGRMGNRPGTSDGYDYRGGMWLQTTGRYAVDKYCKELGVAPSPHSLDDPLLTLRFACAEWVHSECNKWADENDIVKVSKAINTGSATSNVKPVGMSDRRAWFAKAWSIWGGKGKPDTAPEAPSSAKPMALAGTATTLAAIPNVPQSWLDTVSSLSVWQAASEKVSGFAKAAISAPVLAVAVAIVIAGVWFWPQIAERIKRLWRPA
jgi:putative chitinase